AIGRGGRSCGRGGRCPGALGLRARGVGVPGGRVDDQARPRRRRSARSRRLGAGATDARRKPSLRRKATLMFPLATLQRVLARFAGRRVVVVGDLIADEYLFGKPARISREAPVLILRWSDREVRLGGAANAAHNVHALGAEATAIGVLGRDGAGDEVEALFRRAGMSTATLIRARDRLTPVKTRIMAGAYQSTRQQVVRLDRDPEAPLSPDAESLMLDRLRTLGEGADAFLVSDYGYGTVTARVFDTVLEIAGARGAV